MIHYKVAVMETLRKVVTVEAANEREAHRRVADAWKNGEVLLTCEDFTGAEFCVVGEDDGDKSIPQVDGRMAVMTMPNRSWLTIPEMRASRYVLAYGSNLSLERMKRRCPSCKVVGTAEIPGYRLLFKKSMTGAYATIEQDANWTVPVVVYRISASDELRLDRFEGCPAYYYKHEFMLRVKRTNGRKTRELCAAYIMHEYRALGKPGMDYFRLLDMGYAQYGFDLQVLDEGLAASIGRKEAEDYIQTYLNQEAIQGSEE